MALKELGIVLREAREAKGLDIADVAIRIKVAARVLRAIEAGDQDELPYAVYARGFIKSYAALLGVDSDLVMHVINSVYPYEMMDEFSQTPGTGQPRTRARKAAWPQLVLVVLVLLLALGGGWYYRQQTAREADVPPVAQPAQSALPPGTSPGPFLPDLEPSPAPDAGTRPPAVNATIPAPRDAAPVTNSTVPAFVAAPDGAPEPLPSAATPANGVFDSDAATMNGVEANESMLAGGMHRIVLIALADCWVHSSADDSDVRQFSLRKGQAFALTFSRRLTLKLGNAGGVRIRYNGRDLPAPGEPGQVRTLVFPLQAP